MPPDPKADERYAAKLQRARERAEVRRRKATAGQGDGGREWQAELDRWDEEQAIVEEPA